MALTEQEVAAIINNATTINNEESNNSSNPILSQDEINALLNIMPSMNNNEVKEMNNNFDPNVTTNNNATNDNEVTTMNTRTEINFKSKDQIINSVKAISEDDFLTIQVWEFNAIKSIVAGKVTANDVIAKIGDAQTSNVFDQFLNAIINVTTITPKDELMSLLDKEANKKPATAVIGNFIGNLVRSSVKGSADVLSAAKATYKAAKGDVGTTKTNNPKF
jgi:uncharacterized protein YejL (UPF0352 family)